MGAVALAVLFAVAIPPPADGLVDRGLARVFSALVAAALVALAGAYLLWSRRLKTRGLAMALAAVWLAAGVAAFAARLSATGVCTARHDGRSVVIGAELTPVGRQYAADNPSLSASELLFDSAGVASRVWTAESIEQCRIRLLATHVLWIPCLIMCVLTATHAWSTGHALLPARDAPAQAGIPVAGRVTAPRYDVFISYRHGGRDGEFARELLHALEEDGYRVAIDERDFPANASFLQEMERCVRESRITVSLVSPRYLGSGHCEEEAILCRVLDMGDRKRRLVPMILEPVELPAWLFGLVGIDCTKDNPLVEPFDRLKAVLGKPLSA